MGRLTKPILEQLGIPTWDISQNEDPAKAVGEAQVAIQDTARAAALLVAPDAFGWQP
jgi:sulfopyruvate decarboxylase TPP-binding subunit